MKQRQPCIHKQQRRLRHEDSVRSLRMVNDMNRSSSGLIRSNEQSFIDWQHQTNLMTNKNNNSNRRIARQREQYGKISTRLSSSKSGTNLLSHNVMGPQQQQQFTYPTAYTTINRDNNTFKQRSSPQQQLREQLQKQINQLYPIKKSFTNLSMYYQQITSQYDSLLNQMHYLDRINPSSINTDRGQLLRQMQVQYQQKSDYLNIHLVPKLTQLRKDNLYYCQVFNQLDEELKHFKQLMRNNAMERQILVKQQTKLNQQLNEENIQHKKSISTLQKLTIDLQDKKQTQSKYKSNLLKLKSTLQTKYHKQTQLLQAINENKVKNNTLIDQQKTLKDKQKLAQQLNHQRLNRVSVKTLQLKNVKQKTYDLQKKLSQSNKQTIELQVKIQNTQPILMQKQSLLQFITQKQLPQSQNQYNEQKQLYIKNTKFLTYLKQYERQLRQTSNIMFQKLNQCCKQDYQKLIKNKSIINTNPNTNGRIEQQLNTNHIKTIQQNISNHQQQKQLQNVNSYQDASRNEQQQSQLNQLNLKLNNFKFDKQSVEKLLKQRKQIQQLYSNPYLNFY